MAKFAARNAWYNTEICKIYEMEKHDLFNYLRIENKQPYCW